MSNLRKRQSLVDYSDSAADVEEAEYDDVVSNYSSNISFGLKIKTDEPFRKSYEKSENTPTSQFIDRLNHLDYEDLVFEKVKNRSYALCLYESSLNITEKDINFAKII